jgi:hypothetical protein
MCSRKETDLSYTWGLWKSLNRSLYLASTVPVSLDQKKVQNYILNGLNCSTFKDGHTVDENQTLS